MAGSARPTHEGYMDGVISIRRATDFQTGETAALCTRVKVMLSFVVESKLLMLDAIYLVSRGILGKGIVRY